jgi:hypothetical protein
MQPSIDTLLLLALPASGKSELRRYLASLDREVAARDFGLGPTVQLDDYPYVHLMRRVSEELRRLGEPPDFFASDAEPFLDGGDWATLIELVNEDYDSLGTDPSVPSQPTAWMLERFERARHAASLTPPFERLSGEAFRSLTTALDAEVTEMARDLSATLAGYERNMSTVVIEFARGGPEGAVPPLSDPHGYGFSLRHLSPQILSRAAALYVWVTPEESRRRNLDRAVPGLEGDASILHHGVPEVVMRGDYGVDDFLWLMDRGGGQAIDVETNEGTFSIPAAVFDNRIDHTSFLRADQSEWDALLVDELHHALTASFADLGLS